MLSELEHAIVLVGRRLEALEETAQLLAGESLGVSADIGEADSALEIVDSTMERFGRIDVVINNAGYAPLAAIGETTPELMEQVFAINAIGPGLLIGAAWEHLVECKRGCIVNLSTLGTHDPFQGFFAYASAKAAVNLMARSCAKEGKAHGIRAFAVAPGAVETEMLRANFPESRVPRSACLQPEDVARVVVDCVTGKYDARNGDTLFVSAQTGVR
jgi:glucose 1-dehydrogenase